MTPNPDRIAQLTKQFYLGQTSEDEEEELYDFMNTHPEYMKIFNRYNSDFQASNQATNLAWERLSIRRKPIPEAKTSTIRNLFPFFRYAAVFLLALLCYYGVQQLSYKSESYCELIVPKGQKSQLLLPDGSKVWINSESKLRYPTNFSKESRFLELSGEAYFQVTHDENHPFIVRTNEYDVKVHGTEFNLMAYDDFGRTETILLKGSVEIIDAHNSESIILKPNEKLTYSKTDGKYKVTSNTEPNVGAWKDNQFVFIDVPFKELCSRLSRWYDVDVVLADTDLEKIRYRGNFKNKETIWQVMDIIKTTTPIDYKLQDRKLTIFKK